MILSLQLSGHTLLYIHEAAKNGHTKVIELLLSRGADVNSLDNVSNSIMM